MIKDISIYFVVPTCLVFSITLFISTIKEHEAFQEEIHFQGEHAYNMGLPPTVNPYTEERGQVWLDGYLRAKANHATN